MRGGALLLLVLGFALAGCGEEEAIPAVDLRVHVALEQRTLRPGQGTTLTVTRVWRKGHEPSPFDASALAPLVVRDEQVERREDAERIQETRTYRAYAFRLEDITVPEIAFASRPAAGEGIEGVRVARSEALHITILPELDPERPGPPELPGEAPPAPPPNWAWVLGLLALVAGFEGVAGLRRVRERAALLARAREPGRVLAALRAEPAESAEGRRAQVMRAVDAVRDHLALRAGIPARARTSEEIRRALVEADASAWRVLADQGDGVKFAAREVTAEDLADALDRAIRFVGSDRGSPTP